MCYSISLGTFVRHYSQSMYVIQIYILEFTHWHILRVEEKEKRRKPWLTSSRSRSWRHGPPRRLNSDRTLLGSGVIGIA